MSVTTCRRALLNRPVFNGDSSVRVWPLKGLDNVTELEIQTRRQTGPMNEIRSKGAYEPRPRVDAGTAITVAPGSRPL